MLGKISKNGSYERNVRERRDLLQGSFGPALDADENMHREPLLRVPPSVL